MALKVSSRSVNVCHEVTYCSYMRRVLHTYEEFRGRSVESNEISSTIKFWDLVVITTADDSQTTAYRRQIALKVERAELPLDLTFRVYSDTPANIKIGSGGSVLNALKELHNEYGDKLFDLRVLFICAGGLSQRLPTASVLGKLFLTLPICDRGINKSACYHMLDLKLALYLPFLQRAAPGVFVTCSDDVETYFLPPSDEVGSKWTFAQNGFTALGHISSVAIGRSHGVYVLESNRPADILDGADVQMFPCKQVLQKPSFDLMKKTGALLKRDEDTSSSVCTDSVYFFDANVCKSFVHFLAGPITCEVDAYGDFLRPLGADADLVDYVEESDTVVTVTSTLSCTRRHLYDLLHPFPLHVIVPKRSQFYHVGTMVEYVENLTETLANSTFFDELNCINLAFSCVGNVTSETEFRRRFPQVTVMHSVIGCEVLRIGPRTVLEFCDIKGPVNIGGRCIISNCSINNNSDDEESSMDLPSNCCLHTIAVQLDEREMFVTVAFGLNDDLKMKSDVGEEWTTNLTYMGHSLGDVCRLWGLKRELIFDESTVYSCKSLWSANLFPVGETMEESFRKTLDLVVALQKPIITASTPSSSMHVLSMQKALQYKDVDRMLSFQEGLYNKINAKLH